MLQANSASQKMSASIIYGLDTSAGIGGRNCTAVEARVAVVVGRNFITAVEARVATVRGLVRLRLRRRSAGLIVVARFDCFVRWQQTKPPPLVGVEGTG